MTVVDVDAPELTLNQRLGVVLGVMDPGDAGAGRPGSSSFDLLSRLVDVVRGRDHDATWLMVVGMTGAYPAPALVRTVHRALTLKEGDDALVWLLDAVAPLAMAAGDTHAELRIVADRPVVDVNLTARSEFLTGIQRVVRGVASRWSEAHDIELVVWNSRVGAYRALRPHEHARLLRAEAGLRDTAEHPASDDVREIVVPWKVPLVLTEVPPPSGSDRLSAVAEHGVASMRLIGYDCIPMSSAETVPLAEPEKFGRYLELVKHSERLAGISRSASAEFAGFNRAVAAQGLRGPDVTTCALPDVTSVSGGTLDTPAPGRPVVVCVGTVGRRKNQAVLVEAAEMLWRDGIDFELRIFGHLGSEHSALADLVPRLQDRGRPLALESGVSDATIAATLDHARCLVFPSLHEGFGLPIVEALSHGVPVITSDFGSMREVAEGRGGILVDPEDVGAVTAALRCLLTDDAVHARLVEEARARPVRTWTDYAADLWSALVP